MMSSTEIENAERLIDTKDPDMVELAWLTLMGGMSAEEFRCFLDGICDELMSDEGYEIELLVKTFGVKNPVPNRAIYAYHTARKKVFGIHIAKTIVYRYVPSGEIQNFRYTISDVGKRAYLDTNESFSPLEIEKMLKSDLENYLNKLYSEKIKQQKLL